MARYASLQFSYPKERFGFGQPVNPLDTIMLEIEGQQALFTAHNANTSFLSPIDGITYFFFDVVNTSDLFVQCANLCNAITGYLAGVGNNNYSATLIQDRNIDLNCILIRANKYGDNYNLPASVKNISNGDPLDFSIDILVSNFDPPTVTPTVQNALCFGSPTGSISLAVSGGVAPYTYLWSDGITTKDRPTLPAGTHTVTVTDSTTTTPPDNNPPNHAGITVVQITVTQNSQIVISALVQGNSITLNASGGIAPYSYQWSDGVTTKDRSNVTPRNYSVTVTDSVGCTGTAEVAMLGFRFYFSRNPIVLPLQAANLNTKPNLSYLCEVWIENEYLSGNFTKIIEMEQPADSAGKTTFQVQAVLDKYLEPQLPAFNQSNVTLAGSVFKRYYLKYTEKYGVVPEPGPYSQSNFHYVLLGGLSFEEYGYNTFFNHYLPTQKPFFTWEPRAKEAYADQPEYLYFMPNSFALTSFKCQAVVKFTDGTSQSVIFHTQNSVNRYEFYCIPVGYTQRNLAALQPLKQVKSWEITVLDTSNQPLTETRSFRLISDYHQSKRYLLFLNSIGGYNTLVCTGKAELGLDTDSQTVRPAKPYNYNPVAGETAVIDRLGKPTLQFSTGYLDRRRDKEKLAAIQDFLISKHVILVGEGRYVAGNVVDKTYKPFDESASQIALQISYALPEMANYTPQLFGGTAQGPVPIEAIELPTTPEL